MLTSVPTSIGEDTMSLPELTLIVAATSKMGIGLKGTLPWTGLKKEMAYFARVTKRNHTNVCLTIPTPYEEYKMEVNYLIL